MSSLKRAWDRLVDLVEGEDAPGSVVYDPVHVAGVVVGCLCALGVLFWLLWALLVCEGGIFTKVGPALQVLFTSKTLKDFGYEGAPYALGVFEGWIVNAAALILTAALAWGLWRTLRPQRKVK
jgi:hypothetical protein